MRRYLHIIVCCVAILFAACVSSRKGRLWSDISPYFEVPAKWQDDMGSLRSVLTFDNGEKVQNKSDWSARRDEIKRLWHESMGEWPEIITNQPLQRLDSVMLDDGILRYKVRFKWTPAEYTEGYLLVPPHRRPMPAVITLFYEPETAIGLGSKPNRDFAIQLAKRGFVALSLGTTETTKTQTYAIRYPEKGGESVEPLSMLAYAAANAYEALAMEPMVQSDKIGVVGHSYGGKWAMFASCLYEKFACAAWGDAGILFAEDKGGMVNYWEPWYLGSLGTYERMKAAGHNLHELHALMAPRPFLVSGGYSDEPSQWRALNHSVEVNRLLGYENRVAMTNRELHEPNEEANEVIYKFFEYFLK